MNAYAMSKDFARFCQLVVGTNYFHRGFFLVSPFLYGYESRPPETLNTVSLIPVGHVL